MSEGQYHRHRACGCFRPRACTGRAAAMGGRMTRPRRRDVLKASGYALVAMATTRVGMPAVRAERRFEIQRDVCIIGGGSAGTYTAVRLEDFGKSVVILERTDRLGGHAETYINPANGQAIDIGVIFFENTQLVQQYFNRFGVTTGQPAITPPNSVFVDFRTGRIV